MLRVSDNHRRARIARRHGLAPEHRFTSIVEAADAMTALHATEGTTVHLALHARMNGLTVHEVERALYEERSLVKQMCMRRTIFALTRDVLPAAIASAGRRVGTQQVQGLLKSAPELTAGLGEDWVDQARATLVDVLTGQPRSAKELKAELPHLAGSFRYGSGKWAADVPVMSRLLVAFCADGDLVRGPNNGHWRLTRPLWASMRDWLGEELAIPSAQQGWAELVRRWLWSFGPGTEEDLVWWLGATKTATRQALADVEAQPVELEDGRPAWVLRDDTADLTGPAELTSWAALLPTLDPTTMGWKHRDWYLDPGHVKYLFDSNGNSGTLVWVDGRIVGAWVQDEENLVRLRLLEEVSAQARRLLEVEVERLDAFLGGERITNVYTSQLMRGATLP